MRLTLYDYRARSWNPTSRQHYHETTRQKTTAYVAVHKALEGVVEVAYPTPCNIVMRSWSQWPPDSDNLCLKQELDALVDAGVLPDDKPAFVQTVIKRSSSTPRGYRVPVVVITFCGVNDWAAIEAAVTESYPIAAT